MERRGSTHAEPRDVSAGLEGTQMSFSPRLQTREQIPTHVYGACSAATHAVAAKAAAMIKHKTGAGGSFVLGVAVDSALGGVYEELVAMHQAGKLSFKNVHVVIAHEYYPMAKSMQERQSHATWIHSYLTEYVDIPAENIHRFNSFPQEAGDIDNQCSSFWENIAKLGGIDLLLLGVSGGGRIGFNEPGDAKSHGTQVALVELDQRTRVSAASDFFGIEHVPTHGYTLTLDAVMDAKAVIVIAFSEGKAETIATIVEGSVTSKVPASCLQQHKNAIIVTDESAAASLMRFKCPWELGSLAGIVSYDPMTERKAVIWLSLKTNKSILRLTSEDYTSNHLLQLVKERGPAYDINIRVFNHLRDTVTGWPGGKAKGPTAGKVSGFPKRILVFSPHPDDDVISMGGTLIRLCDQGHDVHVCYQTSGNIAVWDDYARQFAHFVSLYSSAFGMGDAALKRAQDVEGLVEEFTSNKEPGQVDPKEMQHIKGLIRQAEAREAARYSGVKPGNIHFLNLPFYETGKVKKNPLSDKDTALVRELLEKIQPQQIYAAGDLSDPHGTHRVCLNAIIEALKQVGQQEWYKNACEVWLYRGAWQEWEPERIQMAVPVSPQELYKKRLAIFRHQSQKDVAPFPGTDKREFWQRSEARNRATAKLFDSLGLQEYEAIEAFVLYDESLNF
eukprot:TRINITY_DN1907_c0_g1_i2.p1 TRINITY_DN1907_c0_g1~~TRINITY_DN1907_c0_g1_i2.p1  ORF type:complete len:673 (+),score=115.29 TRINITY_DN1907_c0_g1_i2:132-2150(+)